MKRLLLVILALAAGWASGCATAWSPRTISACYAPSGDVQLDRERSYYAALIAANERKYVIARTDTPRQLEIEYQSAYKPEQGHAHWLIDVAADASLSVQSVPAGELLSRKRQKRLQQWFGMFSDSTRRLVCRDLNWLRWEAQNRGLAPLGDHAAEMARAEIDASGAQLPAPAADTVEPDPRAERERGERRSALRRERDAISLVAPIALLATGVGLLGGSIGLAEVALSEAASGCRNNSIDGQRDGSCADPTLRRNLAIGAGAVGLAAIAAIAGGAPLLARRLRRKLALNRELRALEEPRFSLDGGARELRLVLSGRF